MINLEFPTSSTQKFANSRDTQYNTQIFGNIFIDLFYMVVLKDVCFSDSRRFPIFSC